MMRATASKVCRLMLALSLLAATAGARPVYAYSYNRSLFDPLSLTCINSGQIDLGDSVSPGVSGRGFHYVGGIKPDGNAAVAFLNIDFLPPGNTGDTRNLEFFIAPFAGDPNRLQLIVKRVAVTLDGGTVDYRYPVLELTRAPIVPDRNGGPGFILLNAWFYIGNDGMFIELHQGPSDLAPVTVTPLFFGYSESGLTRVTARFKSDLVPVCGSGIYPFQYPDLVESARNGFATRFNHPLDKNARPIVSLPTTTYPMINLGATAPALYQASMPLPILPY